MGTVVEELVKKLVKKLVDEKYGQKALEIQLLTKAALPSYVGKPAMLCRERKKRHILTVDTRVPILPSYVGNCGSWRYKPHWCSGGIVMWKRLRMQEERAWRIW